MSWDEDAEPYPWERPSFECPPDDEAWREQATECLPWFLPPEPPAPPLAPPSATQELATDFAEFYRALDAYLTQRSVAPEVWDPADEEEEDQC